MSKNLSITQKKLLEKGYNTIPIIARRYSKGDTSSLEGYLLEKLIHIIQEKLDGSLPYYTQWKYISRSLNGHTKNYFRDESRMIKLPRPIHDRYQAILSYKKKFHLLNPTKEQICTKLGIGLLEYEEAMNEYSFQLMPIDAYNGNVGESERSESEEFSIISCISPEDKDYIERKEWNRVSNDGKESLRLLGFDIDSL